MSRPGSAVFVPLLLAAVLTRTSPSHAVIGTLDAVPAATLLVPWFEEDLDNPNGQTTHFVVSSARPEPTLAKVILWTDAGIATLSFHLYLTGFDAQVIRVRDLFAGQLPNTAPANFDPADTISPHGPDSQDTPIAGCAAADFPTAPLPADAVAKLRRQHLGQAEPGTNTCVGLRYDDGIARGYITVDVVQKCSPLLPADAEYFFPGLAVASDDNALVGEVRHIDPTTNSAWGDVAIHVEADPTDPITSTVGSYTFYGRFVSWTARDHREPLATRWAIPFHNIEDSAIIVWSDPKRDVAPFTCVSEAPRVTPGTWVAYDVAEHATDVTALVPKLAAAQRLRVADQGPLSLPVRAGWLDIELSSVVGSAPFPETQGFVGVVGNLDVCGGAGRFTGGYQATALDNASAPAGPPFPPPRSPP